MENRLSDEIIKNVLLFTTAVKEGIIDLDQLDTAVRMKKEKEYLSKHKGSIWQGKNEYWYTRLNGKLVKKRRKEDLEESIIEHYRSLDEDETPTFKSTYHEWIQSKREFKEVKESSILRYQDDYNRYFKGSKFELIPIADVNDVALDEFVRDVISKYELTSKSYSCFRTVVIGVFKYAKRYHYTNFSVSSFFKDFQISKSAFKKGSEKKAYIYSKQEREELYGYFMSNPTIEHLGLAFMCLTGLRVGELAALKLEDNIGSCKLYIHRTETRVETESGRRIVVQDTAKMGHDDTIIIPKAAQRIIDITKMRTHDDEYLFSKNGSRVTARSYRHYLEKACKEIGIRYRPPHQMRKTYASILLSEGVDEAIVKKEMRHTDISTTRAYYQYITESDKEEKDIIDRIVGM